MCAFSHLTFHRKYMETHFSGVTMDTDHILILVNGINGYGYKEHAYNLFNHIIFPSTS